MCVFEVIGLFPGPRFDDDQDPYADPSGVPAEGEGDGNFKKHDEKQDTTLGTQQWRTMDERINLI